MLRRDGIRAGWFPRVGLVRSGRLRWSSVCVGWHPCTGAAVVRADYSYGWARGCGLRRPAEMRKS